MQSKSPARALQILLLCFLWASALQAQDLPPLTHKLTPIRTPSVAPDLIFHNMDEEKVDLKDYRGKVVVVNFWATWCPPCRREMGSMERLYQATRDSNVEILAVNIGEDLDTVFSFLGTVEPSPTFPLLFDTDAVSMKQWKVKGLPTTYIVDSEGRLAYRAIGGREFDHPAIRKAITALGQ
ncbi:MAG: redoxin domain-containing protein [Gammaproteobacteria bacterium]|nr:redoxin domain-containing protein [Gammaproteobacteria bacterium]